MSLAAIRAKLAAQEAKSNTQNNTQYTTDNAIYPFWNMDENTSTMIRFLPDADGSNDFFWVERNLITLEFSGIKGQTSNKVFVKVPCVEMFGENCPILAEVRTYVFQGFVRDSKMKEDSLPDNPIRRFIISPQIFGVLKTTLMDPEIEITPTDYMRGLDFKIMKTSKGGYADYSTSGWARKESSLTEVEQAAIEKFGLFNLKDFLPKKPSESELRVMKEMFDASVNGEEYDTEKWGAYFRPRGVQASNGASNHDDDSYVVAPRQQVSTPVVDEDEEPVVTSEVKVTTPQSSDTTANILAMIRSKKSAQV